MPSTLTTTRLQNSSNPFLAYMADDWDSGDVWGSAMAWAFALCGLSSLTGETDGLDGLNYRSPMGEDWEDQDDDTGQAQYPDVIAQQLWLDGIADAAQLVYATRVVARLANVYALAGLDY